MRLVICAIASAGYGLAVPVYPCAGAILVDVAFAKGESQLSAAERFKLEVGVRRALAGTSVGEPKAALAIYAQDSEANNNAELNRLIERRVVALRESLALFGLDATSVVAVRGDPASLQTPIGAGGFAEIEIALACQGS